MIPWTRSRIRLITRRTPSALVASTLSTGPAHLARASHVPLPEHLPAQQLAQLRQFEGRFPSFPTS